MTINPQIGSGLQRPGENERWIIVADSLAPSPASDSRSRVTEALDLLVLASRQKRTLLGFAAIGAIIALIVALLQPAVYKAQTQILPPQQSQSATSALLGQLGELASLTGKETGIRNPSAAFGMMLSSRTIADRLIDRFDLVKLYRCRLRSDAEHRLEQMTSIDVRKDGSIVIEVSDRSPGRAAEMANAYIEELRSLSQSVAVTEASQRRLFFEQQVESTREQLARAEVALEQVQRTTGLIHLDSQAKALIESIARLRAQVAAQEVQIGQMEMFATDRNPDLERAQQSLSDLRNQLSRLESQQGARNMGAGDIPVAGLEYVRRVRDVKYYESMFELLARQLEAAKIDEAKNAAVIQVVDRAVPADRPAGPSRVLLVIVGFTVGAVLGVAWIFAGKAFAQLKNNPENALRLGMIKESLASPMLTTSPDRTLQR